MTFCDFRFVRWPHAIRVSRIQRSVKRAVSIELESDMNYAIAQVLERANYSCLR